MNNFKKHTLPILLLIIASVVLLPQISFAASSNSTSGAKSTIIVRDPVSGATIFKSNGSYFYERRLAKKIVANSEIAPGEFIIKYKDNRLAKVQGLNAVKTQSLNNILGLALVKVSKDQDYFKTLQELKVNPDIQYVEPNYIAKAGFIPNDPNYSRQWGPPAIKADSAWDKVNTANRANVIIAILDTGINYAQEDFQGNIVQGYDFVNNDTDPSDGQGHGTHVAGIAAAIINNGKGISGIAGGSKMMPVKVLADNGSGSYSAIINGIKYAADHGAKVISMSLGGAGKSQAMQDAVNYAINRGVSVVAASGNSNGPVDFPGNCNGVITVGATDSSGGRASYSNFGPEMDVVAPGTNIYSTYIGSPSSYTYMSGTSMATPFVSGVAALIRAANPNLSPDAITDIIHQSAGDLGSPGFDNYYGYGLVNTSKAVDLALQRSGIPAPAPVPAPNPGPNPAPQPTPVPAPGPVTNLALHKTVTASSIETGTLTANKVNDGNTATRWSSQPGVDPQWIYIDLGKTYTVTKVVLKWETAYAKSYQLQVSNDGWNWSTVYSTATGTGGTTILTGSVPGRYVRVLGTQRGTQWGYSLWEFEVYGN